MVHGTRSSFVYPINLIFGGRAGRGSSQAVLEKAVEMKDIMLRLTQAKGLCSTIMAFAKKNLIFLRITLMVFELPLIINCISWCIRPWSYEEGSLKLVRVLSENRFYDKKGIINNRSSSLNQGILRRRCSTVP